MSFLRPEATRAIARWAETAIYAALTLGGLWAIFFAVSLAGPWRWGLAGVVGLTGIWLTWSAGLSALGRGEGRAPGIVSIDEREVAYFGPHQGGVVSLDDIKRIEIWTADEKYWRHEAEWVLRSDAGEPALIIPISAAGAGGLIDAFAALPGFAPTRALGALGAAPGATITIWSRDARPAEPALAYLPGRE